MAIPFGTEAWAQALCAQLNASSEYRNSAAKWGQGFNGTLLLSFGADGKLPEPKHLLLRVSQGRCAGAEFVPEIDHPEAGFALEAPFSLWKDILEGRALAVTAILGGHLKVRGDRIKLLQHVAAQRALLHVVTSLDTAFPA
jgi:putative sterol carrier protein